MIKKVLTLLFAVVVVFAACHNGSFDDIDHGGGGGGRYHHDHSQYPWEINPDGSWTCTNCGNYIEGTTEPYIAKLVDGKPVDITSIPSEYTYDNPAGDSGTVIIRTEGGTLNINAPGVAIRHYGWLDKVGVAGAGTAYEGHARIDKELTASGGTIQFKDGAATAIPLIVVPKGVEDDVAIEVGEEAFVDHIEIASGSKTTLTVAGAVDYIEVIGDPAALALEGQVSKLKGMKAANVGNGYIIDNNGATKPEPYNTPALKQENGAYLIYNRIDMEVFRNMCNDVINGNTFENETVLLKKDVVLKGLWTPIGDWVSGTEDSGLGGMSFEGVFKGTFDGGNFSITGLQISNPFKCYQALFGYTVGATIKNLTVEGAVNCKMVGAGVVALMVGGTMENVTNKASVIAPRTIAGIACRVFAPDGETVTFKNCINEGQIHGASQGGSSTSGAFIPAGGLAASGIVGYISGATNYASGTIVFEECHNKAAIMDLFGPHGGGMLAYVNTSQEGAISFTNCSNSGYIALGRETSNTTSKVGGIIGLNSGSCEITLTNCNNTGDVIGTGIVGGIMGYTGDGNNNPGKATFINCKNEAAVTSYNGGFAGGLVGSIRRGSIAADCSGGRGRLTSNGYAGRLIGRVNIWTNKQIEIFIGAEGTGSINENTIGYFMGSAKSPTAAEIKSGTLYGLPYAKESNEYKMKFSAGTIWVQDSSETGTIEHDADTIYKSVGDAVNNNWVAQ